MSNKIDIEIEIGKIPDVPVRFDGSGSQDIAAELDNGTNKLVEVSVEAGEKSEIPVYFETDNTDFGVELEKAANYKHLYNKPRINGVELVGNKTTEDLGIELPDVSGFATKDELDQKQPKGNYALKSELPVIPKKVSAFENDKGYLTEHQDISGLATKQELNGKQDEIEDLEEIRQGSEKGKTAVQPDALNNYATKQELNGKQDKIEDLSTIRTNAEKGATAIQPKQLATVATSGSYNDLKDKPEIPESGGDVDVIEAIKDQTISPKTVLASDGQIQIGYGQVQTIVDEDNNNVTSSTSMIFGGNMGIWSDYQFYSKKTGESSYQSIGLNFMGYSDVELSAMTMDDYGYSSVFMRSSEIYMDYSGYEGAARALNISVKTGKITYSDAEKGEIELDIYDLLSAVKNIIDNGGV